MSKPDSPDTSGSKYRDITQTEFWNELMHDVYGPRSGGAIIYVDAENARKGVAKTSGAVAFAKLISKAFGYDLKKDDLTLSGSHYLKRYQEHPGEEQPSVLLLDEFVGAGSGDARRSMSHQNVNFGRAWAMLRTKRVVTFATLPDWNEADRRLKKYADYRLWMRERPIGFCQPYKVTVPFNSTSSSGVQTKRLGSGRLKFPNMDAHGDPHYRYISNKKDNLIHEQDVWDADELTPDSESGETIDPDEARREEDIKIAIRLYQPWDNSQTHSYEDVANAVDASASWVGNRVREWKDGEHRDLVPEQPDK